MAPTFVFPIHDLQPGGLEVEAVLTPEWLASAFSKTDIGPFERQAGWFRVRLSMSGRDVIVRGRVKTALAAPCGRCMEPARVEADAELALLLAPSPTARAVPAAGEGRGGAKKKPRNDDEYEFGPGEADQDVYDGEQVVLDDFLREAILLEVPIFPLCSEQCPGIASRPDESSEPTIDPRLAPLLELQKKKN